MNLYKKFPSFLLQSLKRIFFFNYLSIKDELFLNNELIIILMIAMATQLSNSYPDLLNTLLPILAIYWPHPPVPYSHEVYTICACTSSTTRKNIYDTLDFQFLLRFTPIGHATFCALIMAISFFCVSCLSFTRAFLWSDYKNSLESCCDDGNCEPPYILWITFLHVELKRGVSLYIKEGYKFFFHRT